MQVRRSVIAFAAVCALGGCSTAHTADPPPATTNAAPATSASVDPDAKARAAVQAYLDAMKKKDVSAAAAVVCSAHRDEFAANAAKGDFTDAVTVTDASITSVEPLGEDRKISTALTVRRTSDGKKGTLTLEFTASQPPGEDWCIANEVNPAGATP